MIWIDFFLQLLIPSLKAEVELLLLQDTLPDDLLSAAFTGVINDVGLDPTLIGDICIGNLKTYYYVRHVQNSIVFAEYFFRTP